MKMILDVARPLESVILDVNSGISGYVLSEDVTAPRQLPAGPTTNVDGYAVKGTD